MSNQELVSTLDRQYLQYELELVSLLPRTKIPFADRTNDGHRFILRTAEQVERFLRGHPGINLGLLGVTQIDPDSPAAMEWTKGMGVTSEGVWILRTRRGVKPIYRTPADCPATSCDKTHQRADLLGPKSLCLIPPSIHPSGFPYAWVAGHSPADIPYLGLPEPPDAIMQFWRSVAIPPRPPRAYTRAAGELSLVYDAIVRDIEGRGLRLRPASGGGLQGDCPFHNSTGRMAFTIHPERGWHCFGGCSDGESGRLTALAVKLGVRL